VDLKVVNRTLKAKQVAVEITKHWGQAQGFFEDNDMQTRPPQMDILLPVIKHPVDKAGTVYTEQYFRNCRKLVPSITQFSQLWGFQQEGGRERERERGREREREREREGERERELEAGI
jgi:hypothetical protein